MLYKGLPVTTQTTLTFHLLSPKENGRCCPSQITLPPQRPARAQPLPFRSQTPLLLLKLRLKALTHRPMMANLLRLPPSHWFCIRPTLHLTRPPLICQTHRFLTPVPNLLRTHLIQGPLHLYPHCHNPINSHQPYHRLGLPNSS